MPAAVSLEDYRAMVGTCIGTSDWLPITQELIDRFARCTFDEQFIHVDPERAAACPFGGTIAHGFLTLSLLSHLFEQAVPAIAGATAGVNAGFNSIRFLTPVRPGDAIRARFTLTDFAERKPGMWRSVLDTTVELRHEKSFALVGEWIIATIMPC
jgi:acyl dehydratase